MTSASTTDRLPSRAGSERSPFDHPAVLWLLLAAGLYGLYPVGSFLDVVRHLNLPDTDDYMRLVQVRDLLAGQGWFEMVQHRLMPPAGAGMHWSRFVDAPLAGLIAAASPLVGRPLAEGLVVALWPPLLFCLYLGLVYRAVAARFNRRAAMLSLFAATQAGELAGLFAFGRIDHHNIQILFILGLGMALAGNDRSWRQASLGGLFAACSLAVGLEALPFIALGALFLVGDWILTGERALARLLAFALCLSGGALVLFSAQTDPALWLTTECDALSPPWLWIAGCGAGIAIGARVLAPRLTTPLRRAAFAGSLGLAAIAAFAALFTACLSGPFTGMPAIVRTAWLNQVMEMLPFRTLLATNTAEALANVMPLFLAAAIAGWAAWRGPLAIRRAAMLTALFLLAGAVLVQFQFRGIYVASGFIALVAGPMLDRAITLLREDAPVRQKAAMLAGALLLVSKVWAVPLALARSSDQQTGSPVAAWQSCTAQASLAPLDRVEAGTVLAAINNGPPILVHTHHGVVAAPYHRAIAGLRASIEGLDGDEAALRHALADSGATYLVLCRKADPETGPVPFAIRLTRSEASVPWLERVPLDSTPILLWRFRADR
ncbi:hypothetical protein [Methylobacterium marchantiae]|uniref:Uncharacterized protein n=1 Tax=Methylobacterium marchantiae TaxID=600331 RepID=A0ABW3X2H8_9HYPH|nr:hypothetical protein AIGOOFII_2791 [Methylobacterium marchantiae]